MKIPTDLTDDWPNDPRNDELVQLAEQLQNGPTGLSTEALARIEQRLHAELDRGETRQRWRRVVFGWSMAASILLAVAGYAIFRLNEPGASPLAKHTPIEDRVTIVVGASLSAPGDQALVRLDQYRSLFAD